jgi:hypothetical protein
MNCYITKIVFQIICGDGNHAAQFDEQLKLVYARDEDEAFSKATRMGIQEQDQFYNFRDQLVQWQFVNIAELYLLSDFVDGAEIYSQIREVEDGNAYRHFIHAKAEDIREKTSHQILNLI